MDIFRNSVMMSMLFVFVGGGLGAVSRWTLSLYLNKAWPAVQYGTLLANLIGGFIIGVAVFFFSSRPEIAPEWRLFCITGFLGGLTTFSTFSSEVVQLLEKGHITLGLATVAANLFGSLFLTFLGLLCGRFIFK